MSARDLQTGISKFTHCTRMMRHREERASEREREKERLRRRRGKEERYGGRKQG